MVAATGNLVAGGGVWQLTWENINNNCPGCFFVSPSFEVFFKKGHNKGISSLDFLE